MPGLTLTNQGTLATATENRKIQLWNPSTGAAIGLLENEQFRCYCLAWSPDGKYLAVGGGDHIPRFVENFAGRVAHDQIALGNYAYVELTLLRYGRANRHDRCVLG